MEKKKNPRTEGDFSRAFLKKLMKGLDQQNMLIEWKINEIDKTQFVAAKSLQSCPTVRPHRRQSTRLPCPWDSPGKNTGVGCHFLLQCMKVKSENEVAQSYPILSDPTDCSLQGSSVHGIFQARVLEWGAIAFSTSGWAGCYYYRLWPVAGSSPGLPACNAHTLTLLIPEHHPQSLGTTSLAQWDAQSN